MAPGRGPGDAKSACVSESELGGMEKPASREKRLKKLQVILLEIL